MLLLTIGSFFELDIVRPTTVYCRIGNKALWANLEGKDFFIVDVKKDTYIYHNRGAA